MLARLLVKRVYNTSLAFVLSKYFLKNFSVAVQGCDHFDDPMIGVGFKFFPVKGDEVGVGGEAIFH